METVLLKLQADVAARKQPRSDLWPAVRMLGLFALIFFFAFQLGVRSVDTTSGWAAQASLKDRLLNYNAQVDALRGELDMRRAEVDRLRRVHDYSAKYGIPANLAATIEDVALAEGVSPKIAFELVRVESRFFPRAVSPVGALGLTQLMPATAKLLRPGITREQIFHPETNLRLGFRFFKSLLAHYDGNTKLALLAYNRGPATVDRLLKQGIDPNNGYAGMVLQGK